MRLIIYRKLNSLQFDIVIKNFVNLNPNYCIGNTVFLRKHV